MNNVQQIAIRRMFFLFRFFLFHATGNDVFVLRLSIRMHFHKQLNKQKNINIHEDVCAKQHQMI